MRRAYEVATLKIANGNGAIKPDCKDGQTAVCERTGRKLKKTMWANVVGPASAVLATLNRFGWKAKEYDVWKDDQDNVWDLKVTCPVTILGEVKEATNRWLQYRVAESMRQPHLLSGINISSLKKILRAKPQGSKVLRSTVVGTQWTQARLHAIGRAESENCKWCSQSPGTLVHRHCACVAVEKDRAMHFGISKIEGIRRTEPSDIEWARCLAPDPAQKLAAASEIERLCVSDSTILGEGSPKDSGAPPQARTGSVRHWIGPSGDAKTTKYGLRGTVYTDDSGTHPRCKDQRRVGFAAVTLTCDGELEATAQGALCYPRQTVPAGEQVGSMIGLKASADKGEAEGDNAEIGEQCFDCSLIMKGLKRGREWCTKAERPLADIWKNGGDSSKDARSYKAACTKE
jgi:hypothetical protein